MTAADALVVAAAAVSVFCALLLALTWPRKDDLPPIPRRDIDRLMERERERTGDQT